MISLIYMYNEAVNLFSYETTKYFGIIFIVLITLFLVFNFLVVLLHRMYNVDVNDSLKDYVVDINDIDFSNKKIFEVACLREARLPDKRDVYTVLFEMINKKYLILSKEYDNYYIKRNEQINIENISESEKIFFDLLEDGKKDFKGFIKKISNRYSTKKILNKMTEEIFNKFDYFEVNSYLGVIFNFLKITILGVFLLLCLYLLFMLNQGDVSFYSTRTYNETVNIVLFFDVALLITVFIFLLTYCCGYVQKVNNLLFNKEDLGKFLLKNGIILISFMVIFFINKLIVIFLLYIYISALILNLTQKKYFVNVKSGYLKEKIEAISLEKYIREYSNLKERDAQSIIVYEDYFIYSYVFGITLKVDDELDLNNVLFNEVMKQQFKQNMSVFTYFGEYIGHFNIVGENLNRL